MAENLGKYSKIKQYFKKFNKANQNDLQELKKLKEESKIFQFEKPQKIRNQSVQETPKQVDQNAIRYIRDVKSNNNLENQGNQNTMKDIFRTQEVNLNNQDDKSQSQEQDEQIQENPSENNQVNQQQGQQDERQGPQQIPQQNEAIINKIQNKDENKSGFNKNSERQDNQFFKSVQNTVNNTNFSQNNYENNNNNYNNNENSNYNKQDKPQIEIVEPEVPKFINVLQFNENVLFIDEQSVYLQRKQGLSQKKQQELFLVFQDESSELSIERLKKIYQLPQSSKKNYSIINATPHDTILCLQIFEEDSKNAEDSGYGFVFLNFIYDKNEKIQSIQAQMIKQIDTKPIKCFQLDIKQEIFFYSVESGYLFCFGFDLSLKFCYEVPGKQHITSFFYDSSDRSDVLVFSTNKGAIYKLRFVFIPEFQIVQLDDMRNLVDAQTINYLSLSFDKQSFLVLHTKNQKSQATVFLYPSFKKQHSFETINSNQYISIYDFVLSYTQTNLNYQFFGLLNGNQIAIYCYELSDNVLLKQNLIYTRQIGFSPNYIYFSLDGFASKLIRIYYSNPDQVSQETSQNICRLILDHIDPKFQ